ncbi:periplasmic binding protein-like I [Artemisia annua]|uniref:Periplasmic binding protein-like I n=1 Tax=Artemisia annua TaxID=35608 RepID=A0A2U1LNW1_ARTAN|nr:periplasmic binding protein-like I [Artemisia annua]
MEVNADGWNLMFFNDDESFRRWKEKLLGSVEGDFNGQIVLEKDTTYLIDYVLCVGHFLPKNSSILLHDEVIIRVGVVLDMKSQIGESIHSFMTMAISDFYALNNDYKTRIVLHTRDSKGDPLQALSAGYTWRLV